MNNFNIDKKFSFFFRSSNIDSWNLHQDSSPPPPQILLLLILLLSKFMLYVLYVKLQGITLVTSMSILFSTVVSKNIPVSNYIFELIKYYLTLEFNITKKFALILDWFFLFLLLKWLTGSFFFFFFSYEGWWVNNCFSLNIISFIKWTKKIEISRWMKNIFSYKATYFFIWNVSEIDSNFFIYFYVTNITINEREVCWQ